MNYTQSCRIVFAISSKNFMLSSWRWGIANRDYKYNTLCCLIDCTNLLREPTAGMRAECRLSYQELFPDRSPSDHLYYSPPIVIPTITGAPGTSRNYRKKPCSYQFLHALFIKSAPFTHSCTGTVIPRHRPR